MHRASSVTGPAWTLTAVLALSCLIPVTGTAQTPPPPCGDDHGFHALDFWVGEWTVWSGGEQIGTNSIRKVQDGCAIEEHWEAAAPGGTGQSLFYYLPAAGAWKQVWVTPYARGAGGVKEKSSVEGPEGSVRFQGTITLADGRSYLDRTTLTPMANGRVRQHIEISTDGGETWQTTFDAEYRPTGPGER